jgi:leucyl aminopeptidase
MSTVDITWSHEVPAGAVIARGRFGDDPIEGVLGEQLRLAGFDAKPGQVYVGVGADGPEFWIGLGRRDRVDDSTVRRAVGALLRAAGRAPLLATTLVDDLAGVLPADRVAATAAAAAVSARYRFEAHRSKPSTDGPERLHLVAPPECGPAIDRALTVMRGVLLARDLVNEPGGTLVPAEFARRCTALADHGVRVVVHDHDAVVALGMGGLLGVNRGSDQPSAFVELHYEPEPVAPAARLALVGKGITFDTGGIHIKKNTASLNAMKTDMGGAAAIVGAMSVLADLGVANPVSAYLPLTDNMTGGDATRPGDVLRMFDGTTVEVVDTDAEGRLVLGDAVAYAAATAPAAIVDVATLTHTALHVTGLSVAPFVSTDDWLAEQVSAASAATSDRAWRMPRVPEYRGLLASKVGDMCNRSEAPAASAFAALFVETFAKGLPFAHIDMAAVVSSDRDLDDRPAGATGWGVELLVELVQRFQAPVASGPTE